MRLLQLYALALSAAQSVYGYVDTSPFFMVSTSELSSSLGKLSTASSITSQVSSTLSQCPSIFYILVSQPGVTSTDFASRKSSPALAQRLALKPKSSLRTSVAVAEVVGGIDTTQWQKVLETTCGVESLHISASIGSMPSFHESVPKAISVSFDAPSKGSRLQDLQANDAFLASILDSLPSSNYTILYTTTVGRHIAKPIDDVTEYAMDSEMQEPLHMDMKRDLTSSVARRATNQTIIDGPLFDKYQFFTPGIFMGFLVGFILLMVLYVGISALASLQVTYAAFDKEQGQLTSKKAQ